MRISVPMFSVMSKLHRIALAGVLVLLAAVVTRAQAPEFGYWERTPLPQAGLATFYSPGLMELVLSYRLAAGEIDACPDCVGSVALLRAGDIGRKIWLKPPGGDPVGPFLVVDCARRQDVQPLLDSNWVVDVSYEVGQYWGMNRPLDDVIVFEDPADQISGLPANRIPTPFYVSPSDVVISQPTATPEAPPPIDTPPTAWPTRKPVPLERVGQALEVVPTNTPAAPTPTAIWPPPLTPIITTPTSVAPPAPVSPTPGPESSDNDGGAVTQPATGETEIALGRAGNVLLKQTGGRTSSGVAGMDIAPTARPTLARTPRPNLTPLLPLSPTPTPSITPDAGLLDRIIHGLLDLIR